MPAIELANTLFSRARRALFAQLFRKPEGMYLRELERATGINNKQLSRELYELRDAGIITSNRIGNLVVYRFDRECPIYEELQAIVRKTVGLADAIRQMLDPFAEQIELAYIFGSHATGEQRPDSDIDLMIVGSATRRSMSSAIRKTQEDLGREINSVFHAFDEYNTQLDDSNSFVARVHHGPRIDLV